MIAVIASGVANISSVVFALERMGLEAVVTSDAKTIESADKVILPGVGAAAVAMKNLKELNLISVIKNLKQPVLGICLGMQLLYQSSSEGDVECLGILPGQIKKLSGDDLIIPHMGWNTLNFVNPGNPLENKYVYYVHSYCAPVNEYTIATTEYGQSFTAIVQKDNFVGMQFHPERSGEVGEQLLRSFI
ncbi:MAG: imidazole glycerol phosphate synthase subunit HisH [Legionellales bacterium]|jgi:glutamine amidotransferase